MKIKIILNIYYYTVYLLILFSFILFILYQYIFGGIILCDNSINSFNEYAVFEPFTYSESLYNLTQDNLEVSSNTSRNEQNTIHTDIHSKALNANCSIIISKYKNIYKRKLYWYTCIKNKGIYDNYQDYKLSWDPNTKVLHEIKNNLKQEIKEELHKMNLAKRTLSWFFKPRNPGGGRGL